MKPFIWAMIIFMFMTLIILLFNPARLFYHGMECSGGIGGGCDTSTATGGIYKWIK